MKITKRIILIILSALLVLSAVACGKAEDEPNGNQNTPPSSDVEQDPPQEDSEEDTSIPMEIEPLSQTLINNISQALYDKTPRSIEWIEEDQRFEFMWYYGTYSGKVIFFHPLYNTEEHTEIIGNESFSFPQSFNFYMYSNGNLSMLNDNDLSDEELSLLSYIHSIKTPIIEEKNKQLYPSAVELPKISSELKAEIEKNKEIASSVWFDKENVRETQSALRYYGTYNGYSVIFQETNLFSVTTLEISDKSFTHFHSFELLAYKDGSVYNLSDVYEGGNISDDDLSVISAYHEFVRTTIGIYMQEDII